MYLKSYHGFNKKKILTEHAAKRELKLGANARALGAELLPRALSKSSNRQDANVNEALPTRARYLVYLLREGVISKLSGPASINTAHTGRTLR